MCSFSTVFQRFKLKPTHRCLASATCRVSIEGTWLKGQMNAFNFTAQDMGSPEIYELSHMLNLAHFGNGGNSWRQCPTVYLVALFTIFQYISYILLDLSIPCSIFEWFQNPIMNTGYLQVLTPSGNFWMLQHVLKDYCQRLEDLPLDFFSKPWRSASVLTGFWAMSSWLCVVRHGAADGAPNSPKWHRWKLPKNWALSSLQSTCYFLVRDVQQTWILHDIKKTWWNAAEITWFLPGDHPGDGLPWLLSIVASADQVQAGEFTDSLRRNGHHQSLRLSEATAWD